MTYPDGIDALVNVNAGDTLAAGGHAARHNSVNTALEEVRDALGFIVSINDQSGSAYFVQASDFGKLVKLTSASPVTVTVGPGLGLPTGGQVNFVAFGSASVSFSASAVDLFSAEGASPQLRAQYSGAALVHLGADDYLLVGDLDS